jgi:uncharacterized protein DUF6876
MNTHNLTPLGQFTGSECYYVNPIGKMRYSEGVRFRADNADCYRLIDAIASYQPQLRKVEALRQMQFWTLRVHENRSCVLECREDSVVKLEVVQHIPWTNFPLPEIRLWVEDGMLILPPRRIWSAKVALTDLRGRRLDYHALRHTFETNLDRHGCSRATKKRLMRHADEDVTDGYAHKELAEMYTALCRIPSPETQSPQANVKSGTTGEGVQGVDQRLRERVLTDAHIRHGRRPTITIDFTGQNERKRTPVQAGARPDLPPAQNGDIVRKTRPSTQVD